MGARGRKSAADLEVVSITNIPPPEPPAHLTAEQAEVWRGVVARMPAGWFSSETHEILAARCRHVVLARRLGRGLENLADADGDDDEPFDFKMYNKLLAAHERETRAIIACDRALRLTLQSRYDAAEAARRAKDQPADGSKPWEFGKPK